MSAVYVLSLVSCFGRLNTSHKGFNSRRDINRLQSTLKVDRVDLHGVKKRYQLCHDVEEGGLKMQGCRNGLDGGGW